MLKRVISMSIFVFMSMSAVALTFSLRVTEIAQKVVLASFPSHAIESNDAQITRVGWDARAVPDMVGISVNGGAEVQRKLSLPRQSPFSQEVGVAITPLSSQLISQLWI